MKQHERDECESQGGRENERGREGQKDTETEKEEGGEVEGKMFTEPLFLSNFIYHTPVLQRIGDHDPWPPDVGGHGVHEVKVAIET